MRLSTLTIIFLLTFVNSEDDHFFEKKVQQGKKTVIKDGVKEVLTVKKVFVTLFLGGYKFRKKKIFGQRKSGNVRALFVCTFCEAKKKTVSFNVNVIVHNVDDQEEDEYVLEQDLVVPVENHWCEPSGIEESVQQFRSQLCQQVRDDPTRAMPALYDETRRIYSQRFSDRDEKILFLSSVPTFPSLQTLLYNIRRKFIPPAPASQEDFDVNSAWFHVDGKSIVLSDVIHSDGLRVLTFSTTENLEILSRSGVYFYKLVFGICNISLKTIF